MATINDPTPDPILNLNPGDVRAACDAFTDALDAAETWLAAYRAMVKRFRASGTLTPDEAERALLDSLVPSPDQYAAIDRLSAIGTGSDPR